MKATQQDIVNASRISVRTFHNLMKKAGIEPERDGNTKLYELSDFLPVLLEYKAAPRNHNLEQERARLASNQADKEALRVEEMRGQLVRTADVLAHWQDVIGACRAKLLNLAQKAAPTVAPLMTVQEVQDEIDGHIHEALQDMADAGGLPESMIPEEEDVITWEPAA